MNRYYRLKLFVILISILAVLVLAGGCQMEETLLPPGPSDGETEVLTLSDAGPITLDPALSSEMSSHIYVMQIFSGLVGLDDELSPVPDIAESWQISQDGRTYTFRLRRGVRFHNGKEVTAQDFKYSWERACSPDTGSQTADTYLGDIVGVSEMLEDKASEISGIEVIDDYTLEVTIDTPKAYFLPKLAYTTAFVVDKSNVETDSQWWRKPVGTGPFKLKEWKADEVLLLESNELYYGEPVKIKQVAFRLLAGMPMALYETNEIDVAAVYESYIERVKDERGPFYDELAVFPELSLFYLGFNTQKPPFDDASVRQAFCHAVNKERIIELTLKGMMTKADGILPSGMPGYNEDLRGLGYDVAKAKALIESSKYGDAGNLPPIVMTVSGLGGSIPEYLGAVIQEWRQNLGVEVTVRQLEPEAFLYSIKEEADEMFMLGWIADYADPQDFLDMLFHTGAEYNTGNYSSPEIDALLDQAAVEMDSTARIALYRQAEQELIDDAACLPLWFGTNYVLIKPYVKSYRLNASGIPLLSEVYLEK